MEKDLWTVTKRIEIAGAHRLELDYPSKCSNIHGHNWWLEITCRSKTLDSNGMVIDFSHIKQVVNELDHAYLNDIVHQPTAENIAQWICMRIRNCIKVKVQESEGNVATYEIQD